ncbi:trypsin-like peptidase domain-containing protein (plasmid) [Agrobacterium vitis]|uniref:trypsin-like peptidase domain-containing protein n=1 Tax=Agrobacterium vitis TaxID=373 RepID=UPI003D281427
MGLRIEIIEGPGTGKVYEFEDDVEIVEIGRDTTHCQVSFPPDFTMVGRRHVAIRNTGGHYDLETNLKNPVLIDGREPFDGESLGALQRLQLTAKGPILEIRTSIKGALPATDPNPVTQTASQKYRLSAQRQKWLAAGLAGVVVLGAAGFGYSARSRHNEQVLLAEMAQKINSGVDQEVMPTDVLQKVSRSTYLVLIAGTEGTETPVGTAWVYKPGLLATNSHVAETFHELARGQKLIARPTVAPYATVEIDTVRLHPDYKRFTESWESHAPVRADAESRSEQMNAPGAGYDVAVMHVTNGTLLQPPLELADANDLAGMQAGQVVGYAGFPMEGLAVGGINPKAPVPQVQIGHITALTDYFLLPDKPSERFLIQHSIPATGGASGSPMVNKSGRVVGLVSGINIIASGDGQRAPNAASVNFAQRADLVKEAETGIADSVATARAASWNAGFATFDDPVALLPHVVLREWLNDNDAKSANEILAQRGTLDALLKPREYASRLKSAITQPGRYLVLGISPDKRDINLAIFRGATVLDKDVNEDWFPYLTLEVEKPDNLDVIVMASDQDTPPEFKLTIWQISTETN